MQGSAFKIQDLGFRVSGLKGLRLGLQGLEFGASTGTYHKVGVCIKPALCEKLSSFLIWEVAEIVVFRGPINLITPQYNPWKP